MVYGKGINDIKSATSKFPREYRLWERMLRRCYSSTSLIERPTYQSCSVHKDWLYFSRFLNDLPSIPGYDYWYQHPMCGICLDKDILVDNNTEYSKSTCVFVPKSINSKACRAKHSSFTNVDNRKGVKVYTKQGDFIKDYKSIADCADDLNLCSGHISKVCLGQRKTHGGYIFKYSNQELVLK